MPAMTLRGLSDEEAEKLRGEAKRRGVSLNALLLLLLREAAGFERRPRRPIYHDLDALAGTWSEEEAARFSAAVADTERIDEEMWR
jgi:hypothetical protein